MGEVVQLRPRGKTLVIDLDERRIVRLRIEPTLTDAEREVERYFAVVEAAREAAEAYMRMAPRLYVSVDDRVSEEAR